MYIETERMIVRDFRADDADDLYAILGDAETMANSEPPYSFEKTQKFLTEFCVQRAGALAAVHKGNGKVIGYILFKALEEAVYEIGWFFNRNYWRQGYAYESCSAVIAYAFDHLNVHKIIAETIDTQKSTHLMEKLGMSLEGIQRKQVRDHLGNWADLYLYGLLDIDRKDQNAAVI